MITTNKIVAVALIAALFGAGLGAVVMQSRNSSAATETATITPNTTTAANDMREVKSNIYQPAPYRSSRNSSSSTQRRVYYDYSQPRGRTFW